MIQTLAIKLIFWTLTNEAFDQSRFKRRVKINAFDREFYLSSPEDTILMKLKWAKLSGGSAKQLNDCKSIYEFQQDVLDSEYLNFWITELDVADFWKKIIS